MTPAGVDAPTLPEALTGDSVRDLLSRLSDHQVRSLLIEQLDRTVAPAPGRGPPPAWRP